MHHQWCMLFILISILFTENWAQTRKCGFVWSTYWMGQGKIKQKERLSGKNVTYIKFVPITSKSELSTYTSLLWCFHVHEPVVRRSLWKTDFASLLNFSLFCAFSLVTGRYLNRKYICVWINSTLKVIECCIVFDNCLGFKPRVFDLNRFIVELSDINFLHSFPFLPLVIHYIYQCNLGGWKELNSYRNWIFLYCII